MGPAKKSGPHPRVARRPSTQLNHLGGVGPIPAMGTMKKAKKRYVRMPTLRAAVLRAIYGRCYCDVLADSHTCDCAMSDLRRRAVHEGWLK